MSIITLNITDAEDGEVGVTCCIVQNQAEVDNLSAFVAEALSAGIQMYIKDNFDEVMANAKSGYALHHLAKPNGGYDLKLVVTPVSERVQ